MFYVYAKEPQSIFDEMSDVRMKKKVYAVQYKHGYPFFTFYENDKWVTRSAKYYVPAE
jgi:hypothetical protein